MNTDDPSWKQRHADESGKALDHPLVLKVVDEFVANAANMGFKVQGPALYGLLKVASYAAQVARAQALGIDPDLLRATPQEAHESAVNQARLLGELGVQAVVVQRPREGNGH